MNYSSGNYKVLLCNTCNVRGEKAQNQRYIQKRESINSASPARYWVNPGKKRAASHASYNTNPEKKAASQAASRASYRADPNKKMACIMPGLLQIVLSENIILCASKRGRYALAEPKPVAQEFYVKELQQLC